MESSNIKIPVLLNGTMQLILFLSETEAKVKVNVEISYQ